MNAVWSFWTKPFLVHYSSTWESPKHHLLSWILSVERARKHFPKLILYTDDDGERLLVKELGLKFDEVNTSLNQLNRKDPDFWVSGKLYAYRCQKEPFIHLDNDVVLWKPLPSYIQSAPIFLQNPEFFAFEGEGSYYQPEVINRAVNEVNGWLPKEWSWYTANRQGRSVCVGIIGGNNLKFISYYADLALKFIEHPANQNAWKYIRETIGHKMAGHNLLFEQYLLSACIDYYRFAETNEFTGSLNPKFLFSSFDDALRPENAKEMGYTHFIGPAKRNKVLMGHLEKRVKDDYPYYYERCNAMV